MTTRSDHDIQADLDRRLEAQSLGIAAWLLKPPDMNALVKSITAALYRRTPSDGPDRSGTD